ncbi:MAG TPA: glycosyltransferase family 1 protein [Acidimicrobiales bacterium]|nr:glycosyltransferase family 1 protein [Acidimicrobiales bacterium]
MSSLRVAIVVDQLRRRAVSGIGTYATGLLLGLEALGDAAPRRVLVASRPHERPDPLATFGLPVRSSRLPGPLLTRAWDRGLGGGVIGDDVDLVHATSLAMPPRRGRPLTVMVHDLAWRAVPEAYPRHGLRWHEAALQRAIRDASRFVVPARAIADDLVAAGAAAPRVEVVEEGCDHLPPADLDAAGAILDRAGVREGYLLTVSTLEPRKNLRRLVEAYAQARPALAEPWPLVVVGPKGWGDALPAGEVPHGVVLVGAVTDGALAGLYRRARCFAYVPVAEGFGLPPVEAMRECVPVVASTAVPSVADAALTVDAADVAAISRALVTAASDESARSSLVTAGLLRSRELTWEAAARRHVEIWGAASR